MKVGVHKPANASTIKWNLIVGILLIASFIFHYLQLTDNHNYGDYTLYWMQAKTLLNTDSHYLLDYNKFNLDNSQDKTGPYLYPWGLPIFMSLSAFIFGESLLVFKFLMLFFLLGGCLIIYLLFRSKIGLMNSALLCGLFALNTVFIFYTNYIMADLPFFFISLLTFYFIEKLIEGRSDVRIIQMVFIGLLLYLTYATRSNGIIFLPVLLLIQINNFYQDKPRISPPYLIKQFVPYVVFIGCLVIASIILPKVTGDHSHFNRLTRVSVQTILSNIKYYAYLPSKFFPTQYGAILYYFTIPFFFLGTFEGARKYLHYVAYVVGTIVIYYIWPYEQGIRFLFPVLPFYFFFMFIGIIVIWKRIKIKQRQIITNTVFAGCIAVLCMGHISRIVTDQTVAHHGPYSQQTSEMFEFLRKNTNASDIIIFRRPRSIILYVDRRSILEYQLEKLKSYYDYYLVYDKVQLSSQVNREEIVKDEQFSKLFENEYYEVYRINQVHAPYSPDG